nr:zinc knuckle CX2CX4HX4C [Tanacetum cinerariifolium]
MEKAIKTNMGKVGIGSTSVDGEELMGGSVLTSDAIGKDTNESSFLQNPSQSGGDQSDVLIYGQVDGVSSWLINETTIKTLFVVKFTSLCDIDVFTNSIKEGKYADILSTMSTADIDVAVNSIETIRKKFEVALDSHVIQHDQAFPSDPIVQSVDIITKSTSYAGAAGASRSRFSWCLIKVNSEADLVDVVTIGIPSLTGDEFTTETIRVEYEWRPPRCNKCKIFGHIHDHSPKKVASPPIVTISHAGAPTVEKSNDGFQTVGKKKKRKCKFKSINGGQFASPSIKQTIRYEPKATPSAPKKGATNVRNPSKLQSMLKTTDTSLKKDNFTMSNSFSALNDEEDDDEEVENVYDESANLFKSCGSLSFTATAG